MSTQRALCLASISRFEGVKLWPALLPTLLAQAATTSDRLLSLRASYALHCVLKAQQAKRTPMAKAAFASLTAIVLPVVSGLSQHHTRGLCEALQRSSGRLSEDTVAELTTASRLANLHAKCLTRLLAYGVADVSGSSEARLMLSSLLPDVVRFLLPVYATIPRLPLSPRLAGRSAPLPPPPAAGGAEGAAAALPRLHGGVRAGG